MKNNNILKYKIIFFISFILIISSIVINIKPIFEKHDIDLSYNYINISDIAETKVKTKATDNSIIDNLFSATGNTAPAFVETKLPFAKNTVATAKTPTWRLPTEMGVITQYPSYYHFAYDITSSRRYSENIFPIANGVISGMYKDSAGALIVTVYHNINGKDYTSQYVHLSRYANGLYVGKPVTVNDSLGLMGSTGRSTGPHLHIAVVDCHLFEKNDKKCPDLNSFFRYGKLRYNQGYRGLGSQIKVPYSWNSR